MKQYNVTAQVYNKFDPTKQTILMNEIVPAISKHNAIDYFTEIFTIDYFIMKIYSVEEI